jgi:hypothetical protein
MAGPIAKESNKTLDAKDSTCLFRDKESQVVIIPAFESLVCVKFSSRFSKSCQMQIQQHLSLWNDLACSSKLKAYSGTTSTY